MLPFSAASQATNRPILQDSSSVTIPAASARRIDADLARYPHVLKENKRLRKANRALDSETRALRESGTAKDTVIATSERRMAGKDVLYQEQERQTQVWKGKAKGRFWVIVGEAAAIVGILVLAL